MIDRNKKPHVHAALIKAWADGAQVECKLHATGQWIDATMPCWAENTVYRIKPEPHKWQKEMDAFAAGKKVEFRGVGRNTLVPEWTPMRPGDNNYRWYTDGSYEYRIKPEKVVVYGRCLVPFPVPGPLPHVEYFTLGGECYTKKKGGQDNLELTFEDGRLIDAKVLK